MKALTSPRRLEELRKELDQKRHRRAVRLCLHGLVLPPFHGELAVASWWIPGAVEA
ncbi:hypothetical protein [Sorangium sp. So ce590]|uniref:hypothetical protein n=1 Tax=unclassified Sorangium TaxID=2621164 RepID=UPI003F5D91D6